MKPKISWTAREYKELAAWFIDHQYSPEAHGLRALLQEAQEAVLPRDRHRSLTCTDPRTKRKIVEHWKAMRDGANPTPSPTPEKPTAPTLDAFSLEDLLVEIAQRVARGFESITRPPQIASTTTLVDVAHKHNPFMHSAPRVSRPELLVVGTYGPQEACLRDTFPEVDFVFVGSDTKPGAVRAHRDAEHAFVLTKFISHAQYGHVQSLYPSDHTMINGGMTELKERLREYLHS